MEKEIVLSSYSVKNTGNNKPENFVTKFIKPITGTQLNLANYNSVFPLIYFDLSFQAEKVTRDPKQLIFRYRLSANANQNIAVHAVVLYEEMIKIDKICNELVIV